MSVYPQLSTGAIAQFPHRTMRRRRTLLNEMEDGRSVSFEDWGASSITWRLEYSDLDDAEWESVRGLHEEVEGRLGTFTFFDPGRNLLAWSQDLERAVWVRDPFLTVTTGIGDPLGTMEGREVSNGGAAEQKVVQRLPIPDSYAAAFSVWLRSSSPRSVGMIRGSLRQEVQVGDRWHRHSLCGRGSGSAEEADFGLVLPPGGLVEVFGLQAEAQMAPSSYKRNDQSTGVHRNVRFSTDRLESWSDGPGRFRAVVTLECMVLTG